MAGDPQWRHEYFEKGLIGRLQNATWRRTAHEQLEPLVLAAPVPASLKDSFLRGRPSGCAIDDLLDIGVPE